MKGYDRMNANDNKLVHVQPVHVCRQLTAEHAVQTECIK